MLYSTAVIVSPICLYGKPRPTFLFYFFLFENGGCSHFFPFFLLLFLFQAANFINVKWPKQNGKKNKNIIPPKGSSKKLIINVMQVIDAVSSFWQKTLNTFNSLYTIFLGFSSKSATFIWCFSWLKIIKVPLLFGAFLA